jgi:hypothetical protein
LNHFTFARCGAEPEREPKSKLAMMRPLRPYVTIDTQRRESARNPYFATDEPRAARCKRDFRGAAESGGAGRGTTEAG